MKILALIGSPRKGGNTDLLVDEIVKGSREKRHTSEKLYLYKYRISPCVDCRKCKSGDHVCPVGDDMQQIYPKMTEADLVIFGTPNYWYGSTGQMKVFFDRLRPFVANGKLKGKKGVIVSPAAEGPKACGPLIKMFRMSFQYLGMRYAGKMLVTAYEKGEIGENQEEMRKAYDLGRSLK